MDNSFGAAPWNLLKNMAVEKFIEKFNYKIVAATKFI